MSPVKSAKMWARLLVESVRQGTSPRPEILSGFARDYQTIADHADCQLEAVAVMIEERARHRGAETIRMHLRVIAHDVRQGLHLQEEPPLLRIYQHADGDEYIMLGTCVMKDDETGEWVDSVAYRAVDGPRHETLCVTSQQRWDDRFTPVETPDADA